jgi:hypothetical protein
MACPGGENMSVKRSAAWAKYQEQVAALFRAERCDVLVEASVDGARAKHKVDVRVVFDKYGIKCTWLIECKYWNRSVGKAQVMTVQGIVNDCGAVRGVVVSKRGFQSGAVRAAMRSNITLTSVEDLQGYILDQRDELETLRSQLAEYRCPFCDAALAHRGEIEFDERNSGRIDIFECGYQTGGWTDLPCPFGPDFPDLDEFALDFIVEKNDPTWPYICVPRPKTERARRVGLRVGHGRTESEANEAVVEHYKYLRTPPGQEFIGKWITRSGFKKPGPVLGSGSKTS